VIDFRYHLVSIIAVFLALAVGLLVGVTALSGPAESLLQKELSRVSRLNSSLAKDKQQLINQANADQAFGQAIAKRALPGLLTGRDVVLVLAPGYDGAVSSGVLASLREAGATVTGEVELSQSFLDTSAQTESSLISMAQRLAPSASITLPSQSSNPTVAGQQAAAAVIAAGILARDGTDLPPSTTQAILSPFAQGGYLQFAGLPGNATIPGPATLAVLLIPGGPPPATSNNADQVLVAVAQQLHALARGTVMAGGSNAIGAGSAISAENGVGQVSTVDFADTSIGQIEVVQALVNAANGQPPGPYGINSGKAPSPAPSPSPSSTPSVTKSPSGKVGTAATKSTSGKKK
jgi:hypothetical protein